MPDAVRVAAPAKVNLGLRVVGRRDDGYHLLESLFVPLELADTLVIDFDVEPGIHFEVARAASFPEDAALPGVDENLVVRAVEAFCALAGSEPRVGIRLEKAVPMGAGLGGGSSDAGAVLRTLAARDAAGRVAHEALVEIGARLGADVPFFLDPRPTWVSGIGEILEPLAGFPALDLLLANPGEPLATARVFKAFAASPAALTLASPGSTMRALEGPFARKNAAESSDSTTSPPSSPSFEAIATAFDDGLLHNDLEPAALQLCPAIAELERGLGEVGARWVAMSGSGATVYGVFDDQASARQAEEKLRARTSAWTCVTQTTG